MFYFFFFLLSIISGLRALFECSQSRACSGEVIICQCQEDQETALLWRVFRAGESSVLFSEQYTTTSSVGDSDTRGDYSVVLNSTEPLSSQLSVTISLPAVTVLCDASATSITLQRIDAPSSPLMIMQRQTANADGNITVTLRWEAPVEDSVIITGYLVNVTSPEIKFSQQLRTSNTSVSIRLNTMGEYLAQVVAMNCAGASKDASLVFNITTASATTAEGSTTAGSSASSSAAVTTSGAVSSNEDTSSESGTENSSTTAVLSTADPGGLKMWHIGVIVGVAIILILCIIIFTTVAFLLKKGKQRKENCDTTFQQDEDEYNHINHVTFRKNEEEEYSTLNHTVLNKKEEQDDNYDYCTVRGAQPGNNKKVAMPKDKIPEMSGSYSLIGPDLSAQQSSHPKFKKKDSVRSNKELIVEYAEIQIKTKPEDNLLDLNCVLILIRDVASKWEDLAKELSAPKDEIDHIRKTTVEDYDRLVEVCDWWIQRLYEKKSQPTWRALSKALKRVGYADLAKELMEIYKTHKLPERVTAGPDVPDVLASIRAGSSKNQATPPPLPPYTANVATPADLSASATAPESTYDDVLSASAKNNEPTAPPLPPPIAAYDDTGVNETPPPLPPPISSYDDAIVNEAPPLPPPISSYDDTVVKGAPPIPPKHF